MALFYSQLKQLAKTASPPFNAVVFACIFTKYKNIADII
jgi:hypothetical protein